jgi:hypothetical protein
LGVSDRVSRAEFADLQSKLSVFEREVYQKVLGEMSERQESILAGVMSKYVLKDHFE